MPTCATIIYINMHCITCGKIESVLPEQSFIRGCYAGRGTTLELPVVKWC